MKTHKEENKNAENEGFNLLNNSEIAVGVANEMLLSRKANLMHICFNQEGFFPGMILPIIYYTNGPPSTNDQLSTPSV